MREFLSDVYFKGGVFGDITNDATLDTALMLDGTQVKKRTLGSMAFEDAGDFLSSIAVSIPNIFTPSTDTIDPSNPDLTFSLASQTANTVFAAPNGLTGTPSFRALVAADLPTQAILGGGDGAANQVAFFTDNRTLDSNSNFQFDGTNVGIGGAPIEKLTLIGGNLSLDSGYTIKFKYSTQFWIGTDATADGFFIYDNTAGARRFILNAAGNFGFGFASSAAMNTVNKVQITGTNGMASNVIGTPAGVLSLKASGTSMEINMGVDSATGSSWLQSLSAASVGTSYLINPRGGFVGINRITAPGNVLDIEVSDSAAITPNTVYNATSRGIHIYNPSTTTSTGGILSFITGATGGGIASIAGLRTGSGGSQLRFYGTYAGTPSLMLTADPNSIVAVPILEGTYSPGTAPSSTSYSTGGLLTSVTNVQFTAGARAGVSFWNRGASGSFIYYNGGTSFKQINDGGTTTTFGMLEVAQTWTALQTFNDTLRVQGSDPYLQVFKSGALDGRIYATSFAGLITIPNQEGFGVFNAGNTTLVPLKASYLYSTGTVEIGGGVLLLNSSTDNFIRWREAGTADRAVMGYADTSSDLQIRVGGATSMSTGTLALTIASTGTATFTSDIYANSRISLGGSSFKTWGSGLYTIQGGGGGINSVLISDTAGSGVHLNGNAYHNGTAWKYVTTSAVSNIAVTNGTILMRVAVSNTADTNITWTDALSIAPTGIATFGAGVSATSFTTTGAITTGTLIVGSTPTPTYTGNIAWIHGDADFAGAATWRSGQLRVGATTNNTSITFGADPTLLITWIQSGRPGTDFRRLYMQPKGGGTIFGDYGTADTGESVIIAGSGRINTNLYIANSTVAADGLQYKFKVESTSPAVPTGHIFPHQISLTSAGSANLMQAAFSVGLSGTYTGPAITFGGSFSNVAPGTGASITTGSNAETYGNISVAGRTGGTTTGTNYAFVGESFGGNINIGGYFRATGDKASAKNVGVIGIGYNGHATSPIHIGGIFTLGTTLTLTSSAALIADNGATTSPIFLGRDNGTVVFTIADGGAVTNSAFLTASSNLARAFYLNPTLTINAASDVLVGQDVNPVYSVGAGTLAHTAIGLRVTGTYSPSAYSTNNYFTSIDISSTYTNTHYGIGLKINPSFNNVQYFFGIDLPQSGYWAIYQRNTAARNLFAGPTVFGISGTASTPINLQADVAPINIIGHSSYGAIRIGDQNILATQHMIIGHTESGSTTSWISNTFNNDGAILDIRMKGNTTSDYVLRFLGSGKATFRSTLASGSVVSEWINTNTTAYLRVLLGSSATQLYGVGGGGVQINNTANGFVQVDSSRFLVPSGWAVQSAGGNMFLRADTTGAAGSYVAIEGFNGSAWVTAIKVANPASGYPNVVANETGGYFMIGTSTVSNSKLYVYNNYVTNAYSEIAEFSHIANNIGVRASGSALFKVTNTTGAHGDFYLRFKFQGTNSTPTLIDGGYIRAYFTDASTGTSELRFANRSLGITQERMFLSGSSLTIGAAGETGALYFNYPGGMTNESLITVQRTGNVGWDGGPITIKGGSAYSTGTNVNGGTVKLRGGMPTGSGYSNVEIYVANPGSSGTADNTNQYLLGQFKGQDKSVELFGNTTISKDGGAGSSASFIINAANSASNLQSNPSIYFRHTSNTLGAHDVVQLEAYDTPGSSSRFSVWIRDNVAATLKKRWTFKEDSNLWSEYDTSLAEQGIMFDSGKVGGKKFIRVDTQEATGWGGEDLEIRAGHAQAGATGGNDYGGNIYLFGGSSIGGGATNGKVILAHNGTSAIGKVLIGTATATSELVNIAGHVRITTGNFYLSDAQYIFSGSEVLAGTDSTGYFFACGATPLSSRNIFIGHATNTPKIQISAPLLTFNGITSGFPALKRSGAELQVILADDSAYTSIRASSFVKNGGLSTEFLMADGSVSSGASISEPSTQILYGTGTGVDSSANFKYNSSTGEFFIQDSSATYKTNWDGYSWNALEFVSKTGGTTGSIQSYLGGNGTYGQMYVQDAANNKWVLIEPTYISFKTASSVGGRIKWDNVTGNFTKTIQFPDAAGTVALTSDIPTATSGTYTPTLTGVSNVTSIGSATTCQYMRVGSVVTVSGNVQIDHTSNSTSTSISISLPIASSFSNDNELSGAGAGLQIPVAIGIRADAVNDVALLVFVPTSGSGSNNSYTFTFTYRII
jgi:hypothetical protein